MKIRTKFILPITVLFVAGSLVIAIFTDWQQSRQHSDRERQAWVSIGRILASSLKSTMLFTGSDNLARDQFYQESLNLEVNRSLVRNPKLIRRNSESSPYASTELEKLVLRNGQPITKIVKTDSTRSLLTLVPVVADHEACIACHRATNNHDVKLGDVFGVVVLTSSLEQLDRQVASDRTSIFLGVMAILIVSLLLIYILTGKLTEPVIRLTERAKSVASENFDLPAKVGIKVRSGGELGILEESFDVMTANLRKSREKLEQHSAHLEELLVEKEVLLKEIHHRVKNNLQIISSLLNLQAGSLDSEKAITAFKESQNRIRSMALIHERLYQSGDLMHVDFGSYLRNLTRYLFHSYQTNAGRVSLKMQVDDARLDLDVSIPCGLIVNELVSNALKHAFPGERRGNIAVAFQKENGHHVLVVQDDGIGVSEDFSFDETDSLGWQLVHSLTQQLDGTIQLDRSQGTKIRLTF